MTANRLGRTMTAVIATVGLAFSLAPVLPTSAGANAIPQAGQAAFAPRPIRPLTGLLPPAPPPAASDAMVQTPRSC